MKNCEGYYKIPRLKEQINADGLIEKQFYTYKRKFKKNGRLEKVKIRCNIRGLRSDAHKEGTAQKQALKQRCCNKKL